MKPLYPKTTNIYGWFQNRRGFLYMKWNKMLWGSRPLLDWFYLLMLSLRGDVRVRNELVLLKKKDAHSLFLTTQAWEVD